MPRKRKERPDKNGINSTCVGELPKTFRDLTQLTNIELNSLLRMLDLPLKQKRNHKLTTVAAHLNISTVGDGDDQDPFLQTLADVKSLTNGWTGDIRKVSDIQIQSILNYLLAAHDISATDSDFETYTSASLRTYRATRAYDLWESGHISGFQFNSLSDIDGYSAVKCLANPSGDTSGTQYDVVVMFKDCGKPIGASCTCIAGLGEACTHIAGLMFGIEDFVSRGYKELPNCESTTEKLCKWNVPKGPKVIPTQLSNVSVKKNIPGKLSKDKTFSASKYNPLPEDKQSVNFDKLTQLHHTLGIINPNLPWVKAIAPAIVAENRPPEFSSHTTMPAAATVLPDVLHSENINIVPAKCCEVETNYMPPSVSEKIKIKNDIDISRESLAYCTEERSKIEELTREQASSALWFKYRLGLITASKFQQVDSHLNVIKKKGPTSATENLVETFVKGSTFKGNNATRYGQQQEPHAVEAYWECHSANHNNMQIHDSGLVISTEYPFLGASPDRVVTCDCHGQTLLEVKCPFTLVDKTQTIESMDYLRVNGETITLKETGNSYYAQVQGQMGVTRIKQCDLVVWGRQRVVTVSVPFNESYWNSLAKKLDQFHCDHVFPALVRSQIGSRSPLKSVLTERRDVQNIVSTIAKTYPCGKCGQLAVEDVSTDADASIQCECDCKCQQWFHWRCVNYMPDPENFVVEPAWFCAPCVRNCDIVYV